jgi:hypothetical protein
MESSIVHQKSNAFPKGVLILQLLLSGFGLDFLHHILKLLRRQASGKVPGLCLQVMVRKRSDHVRSAIKQVVEICGEKDSVDELGKYSEDRVVILRSCGVHYAQMNLESLNRHETQIGCHLCRNAEGRGARAFASTHEKEADTLIQDVFAGERVFTQVCKVKKRMGPSDFMVEVVVPRKHKEDLKQYVLVEVDGEQHDHGYYYSTSAGQQLTVDIEKDRKALDQDLNVARLHYKSKGQWRKVLEEAKKYLQHKRRKPFSLYSWTSSQKKKKKTQPPPFYSKK